MKKTLSISLANLNFVLEEDAYVLLASYLEQIKNHFGSNPDKEEIIKDIEYSIADKFTIMLASTKQVITFQDIQKVTKEIGDPHDFAQNETMLDDTTQKKKLYRDEERKVIAGVCAGIAAYFDIDIVWIRALFGILLFTPLFGLVLILYIILWTSTPAATNTIDKIKMHGENVSLQKIADEIRERVHKKDTPEKNIIKKIASIPVIILTSLFTILKKIIPIIFNIICGFFTIIMVLITLLTTYFAAIIIFFYNSPLINLPLQNFPSNSAEYALVVLIYLAILLPLIFAITLLISMIKKRYILGTSGTITIAGLWMIVLLSGGTLGFGLTPQLSTKIKEENITEKYFNLSNFNKVRLNGNYVASVTYGKDFEVKARGDIEALNNLRLGRDSTTLISTQPQKFLQCIIFCKTQKVYLDITMPTIERIELGGSANTILTNFSTLKNFDFTLSGNSELKIDRTIVDQLQGKIYGNSRLELSKLTASSTNLLLSGASQAFLEGKSNELNLESYGASRVEAKKFEVFNTTVKANAASFIEVWAIDMLETKLSGASIVYYKGIPALKNSTTGSSRVVPLEE